MLLDLKPGEKLIFGKNKDRCIVLDGFTPTAKNLNEVDEADVITWDVEANPALAHMLASMPEGEMPCPIGIFRNVSREPFDAGVHRQMKEATERFGAGSLEKLIYSGEMWDVE